MRSARAHLNALGCLALCLALSSCNQRIVGGTRRSRTFNKVISLSPSATEVINSSLVAMRLLRGRTSACNYPPDSTANIEVVAGVKPDYERIARIAPDLIVYDQSLYSPADEAKIKQLGAEVFVIRADRVDDFRLEVARLGSMLVSEPFASKYLDKIASATLAAKSQQPIPAPRVALIM
ncbi:MAG: ABC transporter substrate-binding protein, partial [Fimbriimonas ginsengisoli]|nr:ABC transporter substrate-binding protein [Fimbriimonas ginsengisoli]